MQTLPELCSMSALALTTVPKSRDMAASLGAWGATGIYVPNQVSIMIGKKDPQGKEGWAGVSSG